MRDPRETTPFETRDTVKPGEVAGLLWLPEGKIRGDFTLAAGTTLQAAFATLAVNKGDALTRGFGSYVFTDNGPIEAGWHSFWFARPFTSGEKTTAFRTLTDVQRGIYWPPVYNGANVRNFQAYDSNSVLYTADVIWDFDLRDAYDGPTQVLIEYFASHESHNIQAPTVMQPEGGTFYYGVAQVSIPRCLHPSLTLTYSTGTNSSRYPLQEFSKTFPATNLTAWPATQVVDDSEKFEGGLFIRRKVTAYRPGNIATRPTVTTPTSASITGTTATLGGNVTSDGNGTVTARGVVYAKTSDNADPVIGGTSVTNSTTSGTTGVFTVNVTSLTAATGYTFKAYATNARGTTYTELATFTTS